MTRTSHTAGSLISFLSSLPEDTPIIIAKDEEGNGFKRLYDAETSKFYDDGYDIEVVDDDEVDEYDDQDDLTDGVVLWP